MAKKRFSTQDIYDHLKRMIMEFELLPGARVTEHELADLFNVSRTPVREALHRLETEDYLEIKAKQGCFIRQINVEEISNYYDVRVALETMAVELACENMSDAAVDQLLTEWNPNSALHLDHVDTVILREEVFHLFIAENSGNPVLADYLRDVNDHIRVLRRFGFPDEKSIRETYEEHFEISNIIKKRDAKLASKTMAKHIRKSQQLARTVTIGQLQQNNRKTPSL